ncbi:hypothetical protein SEA_UPYO_56 [Gordonia phage Upyo]|nr:hypothetical protein SEA_UPYO_56 [Gordonia phage Upyo]
MSNDKIVSRTVVVARPKTLDDPLTLADLDRLVTEAKVRDCPMDSKVVLTDRRAQIRAKDSVTVIHELDTLASEDTVVELHEYTDLRPKVPTDTFDNADPPPVQAVLYDENYQEVIRVPWHSTVRTDADTVKVATTYATEDQIPDAVKYMRPTTRTAGVFVLHSYKVTHLASERWEHRIDWVFRSMDSIKAEILQRYES